MTELIDAIFGGGGILRTHLEMDLHELALGEGGGGCARLVWLMVGTEREHLCMWYKTSGFHKMRAEFLD